LSFLAWRSQTYVDPPLVFLGLRCSPHSFFNKVYSLFWICLFFCITQFCELLVQAIIIACTGWQIISAGYFPCLHFSLQPYVFVILVSLAPKPRQSRKVLCQGYFWFVSYFLSKASAYWNKILRLLAFHKFHFKAIEVYDYRFHLVLSGFWVALLDFEINYAPMSSFQWIESWNYNHFYQLMVNNYYKLFNGIWGNHLMCWSFYSKWFILIIKTNWMSR
jgi:hypothetical protein